MRIKPERILCATDFSTYSNHALPYGIALSREYGAKLLVCHVVDLTYVGMYDMSGSVFQKTEEEIASYALGEINRLLGDQPIDWEPILPKGSPADQIAQAADEHDVDLVIAATHGRSGLPRFVLGSVTERLLRTLRCPLLAVHNPEHEFVAPAGEQIKLAKILVGCDFSPNSSSALHYARSLAQEFESELHLMHVLEPSVYQNLSKQTESLAEELQHALYDGLQQRLSELVPEEEYSWCEVRTALGVGRPHEELIHYVEERDIDLIVLGIRGHGLVEKLLVGSTTDRVLRKAPCPVLSVPRIEDRVLIDVGEVT